MKLSYKQVAHAALLGIVLNSGQLVAASEETVVVTANRFAESKDEQLVPITVISREDIERIQPESVAQLLSFYAGIDVVQSGGAGQAVSVFTRGTESNHTLVVIDGVRIGSLSLGSKDLSQLSVAMIERVEVVRGPRAAAWGSDALGAVIQIFTRRLKNGEYSIAATAGTDNFQSGEVTVGFGDDDLQNSVSVNSISSDGFDVLENDFGPFPTNEPDDDGYRRVSANWVGSYQIDEQKSIQWRSQFDTGRNEFDSDFGNAIEYQNFLYGVSYLFNSDGVDAQVFYNVSRDDSFTRPGLFGSLNGSRFQTERNQFGILVDTSITDIWSVSGGYEFISDGITATNSFQADQRDSEGVFLLNKFRLTDWMLDVSVRRDEIENFSDDRLQSDDAENTFNVALSKQLSDSWRVGASRGKGYVVPTFNDLFFPASPFFIANPELGAETSFSNELFVEASGESQNLVVSLFETRTDNLISFVTGSDFITRIFNLDDALIEGIEIRYNLRHGPFAHQFDITLLEATDISFDEGLGERVNVPLIRRVEEQLAYQFSYVGERLTLSTQLQYFGERPDSDFSQSPAALVFLDDYFQLDLSAQYQVTDALQLTFKVNDLTDEQPIQVLSFQPIGSQYFLGFRYQNF